MSTVQNCRRALVTGFGTAPVPIEDPEPDMDPEYTPYFSMAEQSLMLPMRLTLTPQPTWVVTNTSARLKTIWRALNETLSDGQCPNVATLQFQGWMDAMVVTTAAPENRKGVNAGYPIAANMTERFHLWYRKYTDGFMRIAEPFLPYITSTRKLTWDTKRYDELPVHAIVGGFEDLCEPLLTSLGVWGTCIGLQFLKCPPSDMTFQLLLEHVGQLFGINLSDDLTPVQYIILNQFEWLYPSAIVRQAVETQSDVLMYMRGVYYLCILPIMGDLELTIIGYKHLVVPEGMMLVIPAKLWITAFKSQTITITVAF